MKWGLSHFVTHCRYSPLNYIQNFNYFLCCFIRMFILVKKRTICKKVQIGKDFNFLLTFVPRDTWKMLDRQAYFLTWKVCNIMFAPLNRKFFYESDGIKNLISTKSANSAVFHLDGSMYMIIRIRTSNTIHYH